jgi:hypothetical protein
MGLVKAQLTTPLNPKTEIEPRITRIDTDYEEVVEAISKPVWCILKSIKSV